jgi:hypothetical protein
MFPYQDRGECFHPAPELAECLLHHRLRSESTSAARPGRNEITEFSDRFSEFQPSPVDQYPPQEGIRLQE